MPIIWVIALLVASAVLTAVLTPKPKNTGPTPNTIQDFQLPTTDEGTPKAVVFGDCWSGDWTVLWYGDLDVQPIPAPGGKK